MAASIDAEAKGMHEVSTVARTHDDFEDVAEDAPEILEALGELREFEQRFSLHSLDSLRVHSHELITTCSSQHPHGSGYVQGDGDR